MGYMYSWNCTLNQWNINVKWLTEKGYGTYITVLKNYTTCLFHGQVLVSGLQEGLIRKS